MSYAYLHKKFRDLGFEKQVIFVSHFGTLILCFSPWFVANIKYGNPIIYTAFNGPIFLIGSFIFLFSLIVFLLFLDCIFERKKIKLPFDEAFFYFFVGFQQIFLLILAWSVLIKSTYINSEIRFGIFFIFILQIAGLVATFLFNQLDSHEHFENMNKLTKNLDNNSLFN
jgi:hypothetical protein